MGVRSRRRHRGLKTIGILGGLGPQATMDFEARLHRVAQGLIPQAYNSGYPPTVTWYCRHAPFLLDPENRPLMPMQPDPRLFDAARRLGAIADFLVVPANAPHLFRDEIAAAAGKPVLSMIDLAVEHVRAAGLRRVGVVGLGEPVVYTRPLAALGIACEIVSAERRAVLDAAIFRVQEGRDDATSVTAAREALAELRTRAPEAILVGCTEIPLLLGAAAGAPDLINPAQLLAEAAVREALR